MLMVKIQISNYVKNLGLTFDTDLGFRKYINFVLKKHTLIFKCSVDIDIYYNCSEYITIAAIG